MDKIFINRILFVLPFIIISGVFIWLAYLTNGKNHDLQIDYGREVYTAWRISEGDLLYKDVERPYGPLGAHVGALAFLMFGNKYTSLTKFMLIINGAFLFYIYWQFFQTGNRWSGLLLALFIMVYFTFNSLNLMGNFNGIKPYSIDVVIGLMLCALKYIELMKAYEVGVSESMAFLQGSLFLFIFLTKPEMILSASVFMAAFLLLYYNKNNKSLYCFIRYYLLGVFSMLVVVLVISAYLHGIRGGMLVIFKAISNTVNPATEVLSHFLSYASGFDFFLYNLLLTASCGILLLLYIILNVLVVCRFDKNSGFIKYVAISFLYLISFATAFLLDWDNIGRALPVFTVVVIIWGFNQRRSRSGILLFTGGLVGLTFMSKIILRGAISDYGFALCLPALVLLTYFLMIYSYKNFFTTVARCSFAIFLIFNLIFAIYQNNINLSKYQYVFSDKSGDQFYSTSEMAVPLSLLIKNYIINKGDTLLVLPEGSIVNYFTQTTTGSNIVNFTPYEWAFLGNHNIVDMINNNTPDFILWLSRDYTNGYGYPRFGSVPEFGLSVRDISEKYYHVIAQWKSDPRYSDEIGFVLLKYTGPNF